MAESLNTKLSKAFLDCLRIERQEDIEQTSEIISRSPPKILKNNGLAILNLEITNIRTGFGGKLIVELNLHTSVGGGSSGSSDKKSKSKSSSSSSSTSSKKNGSNSKNSSDSPSSVIDTGDFKIGDIVKLDKYSASVASTSTASTKNKLKNSSKKTDTEEFSDIENVEITGVITSISERQLNLAINLDNNGISEESTKIENKLMSFYSNDVKLWIVQVTNEITYNRMESTMRKLSELTDSDKTHIEKLLLGESVFIPPSSTSLSHNLSELNENDAWFNKSLNNSQKDAINFSIFSNLSIIHGPFGTGKTSTVVELIKQLIIKKRSANKLSSNGNSFRILICGPSNISIDTILERLTDFYDKSDKNKLIRIGHPARLLPSVLTHSLDYLIESNDSNYILKDILNEINQLTRKIKKTKNYKDRRELYNDIKLLKKDLKFRSRTIINNIILNSEIVVSTLHGSSARELVHCMKDNNNQELFDTLIIDEVSQSLEPACWIPLVYHKGIDKFIIAGDNKQLSPTIKTNNNLKVSERLSTTIFDRLIKLHSNHSEFTCFLNTQYRMNELIMEFPNKELYDGKLIADASCRDKTCLDLPGVEENDDTRETIIFYDTQGDNFPENDSITDNRNFNNLVGVSSKYNVGECLIVLKHVKSLIFSGLTEKDIGIISPYSAQVGKLRKLLRSGFIDDEEELEMKDLRISSDDGGSISKNINIFPDIEISTVDGFQGREKEVIILSLVRSNDQREVGFLKDFKRLNVSISRSKKQLCIIGDIETLSKSNIKFLKNWCDWCEENADIRYPDMSDIYQ
ncbi:hypothetical protein BVG19_g3580 [[Candida] boidinii]|nr:hypothetical protein BVG19_g3580 [[Candida] boidinii]OWB49599.1 hypothetical protein B5S27_g1140 [[Candida] boidinii]